MTAYYSENDPFAAAWLRALIDEDAISTRSGRRKGYPRCSPRRSPWVHAATFFAGIGTWSYALRRGGWPDDRPVWTGSCPCQPFSAAGKRGGTADERHLWPAWFHLIDECDPAVVLGEQVASSDGLAWLDTVQADLEAAGYACGAIDTCAAGAGPARQATALVRRQKAGSARRRRITAGAAGKQGRGTRECLCRRKRRWRAGQRRAGRWTRATPG